MRRTLRSRGERGASAVEFALVMPFLFLILFGIMNYGIFFADVMATQDGANQSARAGAIGSFGSITGNCGTQHPFTGASTQIKSLACTTARNTDTLLGSVYVKIDVLDSSLVPATGNNWVLGNNLLVCVLSAQASALPLVPLPNGGITRAKAVVPIQYPDLGLTLIGGADNLSGVPGSPDWSWCG